MVERSGLSLPIVALHGFGDSGACLQPFLHRLGARDASTPNLLAHGGRHMPPGLAFGHQQLVADVVDQVSRVATQRGEPVVLLGHSMGASTAAGVAAAEPGLVRALVLEDPPWQQPTGTPDDTGADQVNEHRQWLEGLQGTDHAGRLHWLLANNPGWPPDEHDPWAESKTQVDLALFDAPQQWLRRSWPSVAQGVQCPTLLVVGAPEHGSACDPSVCDSLATWEGWDVHRLDDAGHNPRREQPARMVQLVRAALARLT